MRSGFTDSRHTNTERTRSDKIEGMPCNGCRFMTVLNRHSSSVMLGKLHREYYEEYYCNAKGVVVDPSVGCERGMR